MPYLAALLRFAKFQLPDELLVWEAIPMTSTGKMSKKDARDQVGSPPTAARCIPRTMPARLPLPALQLAESPSNRLRAAQGRELRAAGSAGKDVAATSRRVKALACWGVLTVHNVLDPRHPPNAHPRRQLFTLLCDNTKLSS